MHSQERNMDNTEKYVREFLKAYVFYYNEITINISDFHSIVFLYIYTTYFNTLSFNITPLKVLLLRTI